MATPKSIPSCSGFCDPKNGSKLACICQQQWNIWNKTRVSLAFFAASSWNGSNPKRSAFWPSCAAKNGWWLARVSPCFILNIPPWSWTYSSPLKRDLPQQEGTSSRPTIRVCENFGRANFSKAWASRSVSIAKRRCQNDSKFALFALCRWNLLLPRVVCENFWRRNFSKA